MDRGANGKFIDREFGVAYHPSHVWWLLRHRLGWSPQRPVRQAKERDQAAVQRWVDEDWPRIKANARRRKACLVFLDEFNWKRTSIAAALCYGIGGGAATVVFHVQAGSYDTASLIGVLQ